MKIVVTGVRILLGLVFFVFGLNIFFHFISTPAPPGDATALMTLMVVHGWFKVIGTLEVLGGALLLSGRFVPLGSTILGPILLVICIVPFDARARGSRLSDVLDDHGDLPDLRLSVGIRERPEPQCKAVPHSSSACVDCSLNLL